jgi:hypothetical protein
MRTQFETLKNGKNAKTVWANVQTKEIVNANRNPFGHNCTRGLDHDFDRKYGDFMKTTQGRSNYHYFYYSARSMESIGFKLVLRGEMPLW